MVRMVLPIISSMLECGTLWGQIHLPHPCNPFINERRPMSATRQAFIDLRPSAIPRMPRAIPTVKSGDMVTKYPRRICIVTEDVEAIGIVKLGSGNNLQGYLL